jgi:cytoskeleton protein RodZ
MNSESRLPMEAESAQPGEIGDLLRASRLRQNEEITDVARALRIRSVYLQAIEDGRYDDLPGTVYAIGFIRSYADHLGLDGEQLVNRFKAESTGQGRKTRLVFPVAVPEHGMPRGAVVTLGIIILTFAYGGWYFLSTKDMYVTDLIPPVPETIMRAFDATRSAAAPMFTPARTEPMAAVAAPAPEQMPTAIVKPVETALLQPPAAAMAAPMPTPAPLAVAAVAAAPAAAAPTAAAPAEPEPAEAADEGDDEIDSTPAPTAAEPAAQILAAVPEAMLDDRGSADALASGSQLANLPAGHDPAREIVLQAVVDCWIEIRDTVGNQRVASRLLRKGDKYVVPTRDGLTLVAGNAGGLDVLVGGDAAPSLGPLGVVRRNIVLDPQRLKNGTAVVE